MGQAIKEAQYRNLTTPHPRRKSQGATEADGSSGTYSEARQQWHRLGKIAHHARGDESDHENDTSSLLSTDSIKPGNVSQKTRERRRRQKEEWKGKMMDLPYFLEMVDLKHRYGSNLRAYHAEWKNADTRENFFYWLDYGEGKNLELQMCSRDRLDQEQVRYLSREERMDYLVQIDGQGRLCWKRNGVRIDTTEEWRDSIHGIVPKGDDTPIFRAEELAELEAKRKKAEKHHDHDSSDEEDEESETEDGSVDRYADSLTNTKGPKKILHVAPATILNALLRKSVKKNTWIFVRILIEPLKSKVKSSILTVSQLGRRHLHEPLRRHQTIRRLSAFVLPPRLTHLRRRPYQNQRRTTPLPLTLKVRALLSLPPFTGAKKARTTNVDHH